MGVVSYTHSSRYNRDKSDQAVSRLRKPLNLTKAILYVANVGLESYLT